MLISALLGTLGTASVMAQNVYSLNTVGYINVSLVTGLQIVTVPLVTSPDNTLGTIFTNSVLVSPNPFLGDEIFIFQPGGGYNFTISKPNGSWNNGGASNVFAPGTAFWVQHNAAPYTFTVVGTVTNGLVTNALVAGLNLVGSQVPLVGDLYSNAVAGSNGTSGFTNVNASAAATDQAYLFDTNAQSFVGAYSTTSGASHNGSSPWRLAGSDLGDPVISNAYEGFFYNAGAAVDWVENYSSTQP